MIKETAWAVSSYLREAFMPSLGYDEKEVMERTREGSEVTKVKFLETL